jgi:acetate kinase
VARLTAPAVVACINSGSSSLKYAVYQFGAGPERDTRAVLTGSVGPGRLDEAVAAITSSVPAPLDAVGHRIVHGGAAHDGPALVNDSLLEELEALVPFAPLHLPVELDAVAAFAAKLPGVPQVACFDTAFHRNLPEVSERLPLPRSLWDAGVRRYGFHGLSYEYVRDAVDAARRGRVVIAHLGSGASMVALRDGAPVHTTMGLTPTGGLVMATRTGDLDPGVMLHLMAHRGYDHARLERLVNDESGLLALSGTSADMKSLLLARRSGDAAASLAVAVFVRSVAMNIGGLTAALGGLDTLVFTGGIGSNSGIVRVEACAYLGHLGVRVDDEGLDAGGDVPVIVVETNEEVVIARQTRAVVTQANE